jgi:hypothetical protein
MTLFTWLHPASFVAGLLAAFVIGPGVSALAGEYLARQTDNETRQSGRVWE